MGRPLSVRVCGCVQGPELWRAPGYYNFDKYTSTFASATSKQLRGHLEYKGTSWAKDTSAQHVSWDAYGREINTTKTCAALTELYRRDSRRCGPQAHGKRPVERVRATHVCSAWPHCRSCRHFPAVRPRPSQEASIKRLPLATCAQVYRRSWAAEHHMARDEAYEWKFRWHGVRVSFAAAAGEERRKVRRGEEG